jgi:hypothetical protein
MTTPTKKKKTKLLPNLLGLFLIGLVSYVFFKFLPLYSNEPVGFDDFQSDPTTSIPPVSREPKHKTAAAAATAGAAPAMTTDPTESSTFIFDVSVNKDSVVFFTSVSAGPSQNAALQLASYGYQSLIGSKSEIDYLLRDSYSSMTKGLERINFNLFDPSTFPDLIYRLRIIERDLQRPTSALVINLLDYMEEFDKPTIGAHNLLKDILDMKEIDQMYKISFKSPLRIIHAIMELIRLQNLVQETTKATAVPRQPPVTDSLLDEVDPADNRLSAQTLRNQTRRPGSLAWNGGGFRIVLLMNEMAENCFSMDCLFQNSLIDYLELLLK